MVKVVGQRGRMVLGGRAAAAAKVRIADGGRSRRLPPMPGPGRGQRALPGQYIADASLGWPQGGVVWGVAAASRAVCLHARCRRANGQLRNKQSVCGTPADHISGPTVIGVMHDPQTRHAVARPALGVRPMRAIIRALRDPLRPLKIECKPAPRDCKVLPAPL